MKPITLQCLTALALGCATTFAAAETVGSPAYLETVTAATPAGSLSSISGTVLVQRGGQPLPAANGSTIAAGDTVSVGGASSALMRTTDSALFQLSSDTQLRIANYAYAGSGAVAETRGPAMANYQIDRGLVRTVTGAIGKQSGDRYMVRAPEADIRVHGTDYSVQVANGLLVIVYSGTVTVSNDTGSVDVKTGQSLYVASRSSRLAIQDESELVIPRVIPLPTIPLPPPVSPS